MVWEVLPVEPGGMTSADASTGEGRTDIGTGGEDMLRGLSLDMWTPLHGTAERDDLVFSPRGWLTNPLTDVDADGYIAVVFVDTMTLREDGARQTWTVRVARGGMTRMISDRSQPITMGPAGSDPSGLRTSTSGSSYHPGSPSTGSSSSGSSSGGSSSGASSSSSGASSSSSSSGGPGGSSGSSSSGGSGRRGK